MTFDELAGTGEFQGLFQFHYEEMFRKFDKEPDLHFPRAVEFGLISSEGNDHRGRFTAEVEYVDGITEQHPVAGGRTTGTFHVCLPRGLDAGQAAHILDGATMEVTIETFP